MTRQPPLPWHAEYGVRAPEVAPQESAQVAAARGDMPAWREPRSGAAFALPQPSRAAKFSLKAARYRPRNISSPAAGAGQPRRQVACHQQRLRPAQVRTRPAQVERRRRHFSQLLRRTPRTLASQPCAVGPYRRRSAGRQIAPPEIRARRILRQHAGYAHGILPAPPGTARVCRRRSAIAPGAEEG